MFIRIPTIAYGAAASRDSDRRAFSRSACAVHQCLSISHHLCMSFDSHMAMADNQFESLPWELLEKIVERLPAPDIFRLKQVGVIQMSDMLYQAS